MNWVARVGFAGRFVVSSFTAISMLLSAPAAEEVATKDSPAPRHRHDLTGVVNDAAGNPLNQANIFVYTAEPKEGTGVLCPSCYADCRKSATTDANGHFKIESLDPKLLFHILVVAKGKEPNFVGKVDPAVKPLEISLKPAKESLQPDQQLKGRVLDPEGKPIAGAVVNIRGVVRGESTRYGGNEDLDQLAVSDDQGMFVINSQVSFAAVGLDIEARGYAKGIFSPLASGTKVHELKLTEGATVHGRLLKNGKPLSGVEMGICGADRKASTYVGDYSVGTDKEGKFVFVNLPPGLDYFLYGRMASLRNHGALAASRRHVGDDSSVLDAGDLQVYPGFRLAGRIHLNDGKPVPPKTRVLLSRNEAWDAVQTDTDTDGSFAFAGVPSESVKLSARITGYRISERNRSLDMVNRFGLIGLLKAHKTDLVLEFEPGEIQRGGRGGYVDLRQKPLLGAEASVK